MKQAKSLQSLTRYLLGLATCILLGLLGLKAIALPQTDASTPNAKPIDVGMVTLLAESKTVRWQIHSNPRFSVPRI